MGVCRAEAPQYAPRSSPCFAKKESREGKASEREVEKGRERRESEGREEVGEVEWKSEYDVAAGAGGVEVASVGVITSGRRLPSLQTAVGRWMPEW